jgi:hypothetical protein
MDDFAHFLSPVWLDASGSGMSACLWLISWIFYKQVRQYPYNDALEDVYQVISPKNGTGHCLPRQSWR